MSYSENVDAIKNTSTILGPYIDIFIDDLVYILDPKMCKTHVFAADNKTLCQCKYIFWALIVKSSHLLTLIMIRCE